MLREDQPTLIKFVDRLSSRSPLTERERDAILGLPAAVSRQSAKSSVTRAGDDVDGAWVVVDGLLAGFKHLRDGSRLITALHIGGDLADAPSLALDRSVTCLEALTDVTLLHVPTTALKCLRLSHPAVGQAMWLDNAVDAAVQVEWNNNVGRKTARSRVAHLICEMAARYEYAGGRVGPCFELPMTQQDMGDAMGLTSVHVNRTLMGLREDGIVDIRRRVVQILNWPALIRLAEFDPGYLHHDRTAPLECVDTDLVN